MRGVCKIPSHYQTAGAANANDGSRTMRGADRPPVFNDLGMLCSTSLIGLDDSIDGGVWQVDEAGVDESEWDGDRESGDDDADDGNTSSSSGGDGCCCGIRDTTASDIAGEAIAAASGGEGSVATEPGAVRGGVGSEVLVTIGSIDLGGRSEEYSFFNSASKISNSSFGTVSIHSR